MKCASLNCKTKFELNKRGQPRRFCKKCGQIKKKARASLWRARRKNSIDPDVLISQIEKKEKGKSMYKGTILNEDY